MDKNEAHNLVFDEDNLSEGEQKFWSLLLKDTVIPDYYYKIITKVLKPLTLLNSALYEKQLLDAKMNDLIYCAENIANGINHLPEQFSLKSKSFTKDSKGLEVIRDLSDSIKHTTLYNADRNCSIVACALFEINDAGRYRFLRNKLFVQHKNIQYDFMEIAIAALEFIGAKIGGKITFETQPKPQYDFEDEIILDVHNKYQSRIKHRSFKVFKKNESGNLIPHPGSYKLGMNYIFEGDAKGWRLGPKQKD